MGTVWGQIGTIILAARPAMSLSPSAPGDSFEAAVRTGDVARAGTAESSGSPSHPCGWQRGLNSSLGCF